MEGQASCGGEDGHGVGQPVQGVIVGRDVTLEGLASLLRLADVDGDGAHQPAVQRRGSDLHGLALARRRRPAQRRPAGSDLSRLADHGVRAAAERQPFSGARFDGWRLDRLQPGAVGPDQGAVGTGHPGRRRLAVQEGGELIAGRQALLDRGAARQAQPGDGAGGAALDVEPAARTGRMEGAGLAPVDQAADPQRMVGIVHQRRDQGARIGADAERRAAEGEGLLAGHQPGPAVLHRQHRKVEGVGPGLVPVHPCAEPGQIGVDLARLVLGPPSLGQRP